MFDTPEEKAALQAAIDEAVQGLKTKNDELILKNKKLAKGQEIDPQTVVDLENQLDAMKGELTTAQKAAKEAVKTAETATKALQAESGFTQKLLVDNGLVSELTKHGVTNPVHLKAAQAMLRSGVQIVADGENRTAKFGDKALADYVKEWATGDEGKHFVAAPNNSGGGAQGGGNAGGKTIKEAAFNDMRPADRAKAMASGMTIVP